MNAVLWNTTVRVSAGFVRSLHLRTKLVPSTRFFSTAFYKQQSRPPVLGNTRQVFLFSFFRHVLGENENYWWAASPQQSATPDVATRRVET